MTTGEFTRRLLFSALEKRLETCESEAILGDLEEEHSDRCAEEGSTPALLWWLGESLRLLVSPPPPVRPAPKAGDSFMQQLVQDLRYAVRTLRKAPIFAAAALLTLGLGLGAAITVFSVLDQVVLRPLPFFEPERLVLLHNYTLEERRSRGQVAFPDFVDYQEENRVFTGMAAWEPIQPNLTGEGLRPTRLRASSVTSSIFPLLGIEMALGRALLPEEDEVGGQRTVVLGHGFWRARFDARDDVLGQDLHLDGELYTVVGVLPASFRTSHGATMLPSARDHVWLPFRNSPSAEIVESRGVHRARVLARLAPGIELRKADAAVAAIAATLAERHPGTNRDEGVWLESARSAMVGDVESRLWIVFGAVAVVLLTACANVANLLLAQASARRSEISIRLALGAGRSRLLRQFLTESLCLALGGGGLGLLLAAGALALLRRYGPQAVPRLEYVAIDGRIAAVAVLASMSAALIYGLMPAWQAASRRFGAELRSGGRSSGSRLRQVLVVAEIVAAVVLVAGAVLLAKSFHAVTSVEPGFDSRDVYAVDLALPLPFVSPEWPRSVAFYRAVVEELDRQGDLEATAAFHHPMNGGWRMTFDFPDRPRAEGQLPPMANFRPVVPGYFERMGIPLVQGRTLTSADDAESAGALVVNEAFVRRHFEGGDALGKWIDYSHWWGAGPDAYQIVGVVGDVRFTGLMHDSDPAMYFAHAQQPVVEMTLLVRSKTSAGDLSERLRAAVWAVNPEMPVDEVTAMETMLAESQAERRFLTGLMSAFGLATLALAAIGLYGVLAHTVARRSQEIGVRIALGARPEDVARLVLGQGLRLVSCGLGLGITAALVLTRLLDNLLFQVEPSDPAVFVAVAGTLLLVALVACYPPASRACRVDAMTSLRAP